MFLLGWLSWAAFLHVGTLGLRLLLFFDATYFNIQGTVGRRVIMARVWLLIMHLSLEMTHIISAHIPSAKVGDMEFPGGQGLPTSDSKVQKGAHVFCASQPQFITLFHFYMTSTILSNDCILLSQRVSKCSFVSHQWWPLTFTVIRDADAFSVVTRSRGRSRLSKERPCLFLLSSKTTFSCFSASLIHPLFSNLIWKFALLPGLCLLIYFFLYSLLFNFVLFN